MIVQESFMVLPPIGNNASEVKNWTLVKIPVQELVILYDNSGHLMRRINGKAVVINYGKRNYLLCLIQF